MLTKVLSEKLVLIGLLFIIEVSSMLFCLVIIFIAYKILFCKFAIVVL
jgi:hypothetical protein